ncbi:hypothetical protein GCM10009641_18600 [Mycobacterium cookii]|uniref:Uncharacterized protein n=1 Tax=Mycobacterium cookii TaxID=1775 RepID=A0A7I7L236_9MYCO|nr:protealysin inhibitor emfourin [Mycobacterium cookii]MCV7332981.1 hypothetical protein [Mycobacterium cookii]BBX47662.1 hypothetical protein MCOO_36770 [Mycobacterium cookii]
MGDRYFIERYGGLAGLKASGAVDGDALNPDDRQTLEQLLDSEEAFAGDTGHDRYTYVVRRENASGSTTRHIPESLMPSAVASIVKADI